MKDRTYLTGRFLRGRETFLGPKITLPKITSGLQPSELAARFDARNARNLQRRDTYRLTLSAGLVLALTLVLAAFRIGFKHGSSFDFVVSEQEIVQVEEIEQTRHQEVPPPPPRPPVPIAVADDEVLEFDEILFDSELVMDQPLVIDLRPPAPSQRLDETADQNEIFVIVEEMPEIIGGLGRLASLLHYPEIARRALLEGTVVVQVVIEPDGRPADPSVMRSAGKVLDDAAVAAVMQLSFKPGLQRGRPVRVQFAIPVKFSLQQANAL